MAKTSRSQTNTKQKKQTKRKLGTSQSRAQRSIDKTNEQTGILDDRSKREIAGVSFAVVAIAMFLTAVLTPDALVTTVLIDIMRQAVGIGALLLPIWLLVVGGCFLLPFEKPHARERIALGLLVLFVAIISVSSLYAPYASSDPATLFSYNSLITHGGYLGAVIAWVGITLFGQLITGVFLFGCIIIALVIIGFSLTNMVRRIKAFLRGDAADEEELDPTAIMPSTLKEKRTRNNPLLDLKAKAQGNKFSEQKTRSFSAVSQPVSEEKTDFENLKTSSLKPIEDLKEVKGKSASLTRTLGSKKKPAVRKPAKAAGSIAPSATSGLSEDFTLPDPSMLLRSEGPGRGKELEDVLQVTALNLQETLEDFKINAKVVGWVAGPTVTLFKIDLPPGVRVSRIMALENDIALALAAPGVRIFAPIPGTNYVGIEVPNSVRETVLLGDVLPAATGGPLEIAVGKDVEGHAIVSDLASMPHLLIAGTTGSGKSVAINAMIMSILMRATPEEVRFIMIDPKRVEFTPYNGIPHLYVPVVTEAREAASALSWGVAEMERRLKLFSKPEVAVRNIHQYNKKVKQGLTIGENEAEHLPYIVIIIDELSDLMMNVGKEVEFSISRIAQLARAAGIHLIVATQRPSTNVVTGLIKANITNRISFNVASGIDSCVILDAPGAENLIGLGDLLFSKPEYPRPVRIQGCYVSEDEIESVVEMLKSQEIGRASCRERV